MNARKKMRNPHATDNSEEGMGEPFLFFAEWLRELMAEFKVSYI